MSEKDRKDYVFLRRWCIVLWFASIQALLLWLGSPYTHRLLPEDIFLILSTFALFAASIWLTNHIVKYKNERLRKRD